MSDSTNIEETPGQRDTGMSSGGASASSQNGKRILAISLAVMLVIGTGIGLWQAYRFFTGAHHRPASTDVMVADLGQMPRGQGGGQRFRQNAQRNNTTDGIRQTVPNAWVVRAGTALADVRRTPEGNTTVRFGYDRPDLLPADVRTALTAASDLVGRAGPGLARRANVTDQQLAQLRELGRDPGMVVSRENRQQFLAAAQAYLAADGQPRTDAEQAVLAQLRRIGDESLDATRAALNERAGKVREILSADQLTQLSARR